MSYDYSGLYNVAFQQIADKGRDVLFTTSTAGVYNPATGARTGKTTTQSTIKAVFLNYKSKEIDGELIKTGDKMVYISPESLTTAPIMGDYITENGKDWRVMDVDSLTPGDMEIIYIVQVRVAG